MIDSKCACPWGGHAPSSVVDWTGGRGGSALSRARRARYAVSRPPSTGAWDSESVIWTITIRFVAPRTGSDERYALLVGRLWSGLSPTLRGLDELPADV